MKKIILSALTLLLSSASFAELAGTSGSRPASAGTISINPATIDSVTTLVNKTMQLKTGRRNLQVKFVVVTTGGSTDVSPTKKIYLGLYSVNEMHDLIGTYDIGAAYDVDSITRVEGGVYKITGRLLDYDKKTTVIINAIDAVNEIVHMSCSEFDRCTTTKPIQVIKK